MKVMIIGGTVFIGPAIVEELLERGHEVHVVHRGKNRADDMPEVEARTCDRRNASALREVTASIAPDVVVDMCAYDADGARAGVGAVGDTPTIVLSSQDVYRAYASILMGLETDELPLSEDAPLREQRYPYRGSGHAPLEGIDVDTYEKIDVEEIYREIGALILRLPVVYGERDPLRREEMVLRRVRAKRTRMPMGEGKLRWTRAWVRDVARAVGQAVDRGVRDETLNLGENTTPTMREWIQMILEAADYDMELVTVTDQLVPADLALTRTFAQDLVTDSTRARELLDWKTTGPREAVAQSVAWHLANPPSAEPEPPEAFSADRLVLDTPSG